MATISYPKTWVSGEILTAADLNAEFAAVTTIQGISGAALAVGAAVNNAVSAAFTTALTVTTVETALVTLPSITVRGGRVLLFGFGGLKIANNTNVVADVTWRFYRGATLIATIAQESLGVTTIAAGTVANMPAATPSFSEAPVAGSYVYKLTAQTGSALVAVITSTANPGTMFAVELS